MAVSGAQAAAEQLGYLSVVITLHQEGEATVVGDVYARLTAFLCNCMLGHQGAGSSLTQAELELVKMGVTKTKLNELRQAATVCIHSSRPLCVLGSGETTVNVKGSGKGGRNQELALACSLGLHELLTPELQQHFSVGFLSAGTDGQDGPTEAAGAFSDPSFITTASKEGQDPQQALNDNDTYNFYSAVADGSYLLKTGLTGTNVMDLQILLIHPNSSTSGENLVNGKN